SVEQILPGELLDVGGTKLLDVRLEIHRPHGADLPWSARVREENVDQRGHDVQVLRVWQIVEENQNEERVGPPEKADEGRRVGHDREHVAERPRPESLRTDR